MRLLVSSSFRYAVPADIANRLRTLAYPQLREFSAAERERVLRIARLTQLDLFERIGILGGLVSTTAALQAVGADWSSMLARLLAQFTLAVPLLFCVVGPFLLRRTRRGLDIECRKKSNE